VGLLIAGSDLSVADERGRSEGVKVSIVVPVHNALKTLDRAVDSALAQTMSIDDLELICVDDGSTDDSLARLRAYEAETPNMTVISIPASGWPGKPRNVGTDAASGQYVMYLDADDLLQPEAMQRMYDLGSANGSDIVLGKVTSDFRGVHQYLYRTSLPRCDVDDSRIINSLTPHKMFRRAFLVEQGLRYPEGYHRLEDQLFVIRAYLSARSCSVVSDYVCYRYLRQPDHGNIASRIVLPDEYYERVRVILDEVDRLTDPGPRRDLVYRRILRVEALAKVTGRRILVREPQSLERWLSGIRSLVTERFNPAIEAELPTTMRVRAHLVRTESSRELYELAARTKPVRPAVHVDLRSEAGAALLDVRGSVVVDGDPLRLEAADDGWLLRESLIGSEVPADLRRVESPEQMIADVVLVERSTGDEWFVTPKLAVTIEPRPDGGQITIRGTATLNPSTAADGQPLPRGTYTVSVRVECLGLNRLQPLVVSTDDVSPSVVLERGSSLRVTDSGRLRLVVGATPAQVRNLLRPARATILPEGIVVSLGASWSATPTLTGELHSSDGRRTSAQFDRLDADGCRWRARSASEWPPGRSRLRIKLPAAGWLDLEEPVTIPRTLRSLPATLRWRWRRLRSGRRRA
jgi:glycosyltransferase involved in cell wall biosynthesis